MIYLSSPFFGQKAHRRFKGVAHRLNPKTKRKSISLEECKRDFRHLSPLVGLQIN